MSTEVEVAEIPDCDLCKSAGRENVPAEYDSKTIFGPWAYLCQKCWSEWGVGVLGTGYGQRLILRKKVGEP